jgi:hypothetical protein
MIFDREAGNELQELASEMERKAVECDDAECPEPTRPKDVP